MRLRLITLFAAVFAPLWGQIDPAALVRQSVANYERNWHEAADWEYQQTDVMRTDGSTETDVSRIVPIDGTPFEQLIRKEGQPLSPSEQRKEARKLRTVEREREHETADERQARIAKYDQERAFVRDIPNAFTFKLLGDDTVEGRPAWVIQLTPKPFTPTEPHASMLGHMSGKLWIDKEDVNWAKAQADVIDTIAIGWIMARIGPGARIVVEQTRVAPGFWMPKSIVVEGTARVLLVHNKPLNETLTYSGFEKPALNSAGIPQTLQQNAPGKTGSQSFQ